MKHETTITIDQLDELLRLKGVKVHLEIVANQCNTARDHERAREAGVWLTEAIEKLFR